jgi:hypothetical protein
LLLYLEEAGTNQPHQLLHKVGQYKSQTALELSLQQHRWQTAYLDCQLRRQQAQQRHLAGFC